MLGRPDLSFKSQREALAQAATGADVENTYGQAMRAAAGLIAEQARLGQRNAVPAGNGVTLEALQALWNGRDSSIQNQIDATRNQIGQVNGEKPDYSSYSPNSEMGRLIIETAQDIGADPVDLATAISYETAGTFDPRKAGPTTQWGQHRGLIQFGEPQAAEYGVDWNDPLYSQLGKGKAVSNYFKKNGFVSGMSGLDLYSTINAGAPGRYSASDANNGGAPGDVRDKWENQMGAHRAKALALLGLG